MEVWLAQYSGWGATLVFATREAAVAAIEKAGFSPLVYWDTSWWTRPGDDKGVGLRLYKVDVRT